jgi:hypothetical protein
MKSDKGCHTPVPSFDPSLQVLFALIVVNVSIDLQAGYLLVNL